MTTPVHRMLERIERTPDELYLRYLSDGTPESAEELSYSNIVAAAASVATALEQHTNVGAPVVLLFMPGLDFARALWGTLLSGRVAVPAFPPDPARLERTLGRLVTILRDVGATTVITSSVLASQTDRLFAVAPDLADLTWVVVDQLDPGDASAFCTLDPDALALLQYTSGSTDRPRGVMVSLAQLHAQGQMLCKAAAPIEHQVHVGWAPFFHDMGLVTAHFLQLYLPCETTWMSPMHFLRDPRLWLSAMSWYRATLVVSPDFGFALAARKASQEWADGLDLSSVACLVSSAEPVRMKSVQAFCDRFSINPACFMPAFGLAENTLVATGGRSLKTLTVDRSALGQGHAVEVEDGDVLVSSGASLAGEVLIVDPVERVQLPDRVVGEIWLDQPSVAMGYWQRPKETQQTFHAQTAAGRGGLLRTGDLGFLHEGELFVTGRIKDLIVVHGRNVSPSDVEDVVKACHPLIRPGCVAAFSVDTSDGEAVGVALELRAAPTNLQDVTRAVRSALTHELHLGLTYLAVLAPATLPKTSSGKLRRTVVLPQITAGELSPVHIDDRRDQLHVIEALRGLIEDLAGGTLDAASSSMSLRDLGLDSVALHDLRALLEQRTGVKIGMNALGRHDTLASLSDWLMHAPPEDNPEMICRSVDLDATPIVLLPGGFGSIGCLELLGRGLSASRPVYMIEPPFSTHEPPIADVGELADWYAERVQRAVPAGPIVVCGYSFGSYVAIEVARRLSALGRRVLVALAIDGRRWRLTPKRWFAEVVLGRPPYWRRIDRGLRGTAIRKASEQAWKTYRPKPYWGRVVLFRSEVSTQPDVEMFRGFSRHLIQVPIQGKHRNCILEPHVAGLVEAIEHQIEQAE